VKWPLCFNCVVKDFVRRLAGRPLFVRYWEQGGHPDSDSSKSVSVLSTILVTNRSYQVTLTSFGALGALGSSIKSGSVFVRKPAISNACARSVFALIIRVGGSTEIDRCAFQKLIMEEYSVTGRRARANERRKFSLPLWLSSQCVAAF